MALLSVAELASYLPDTASNPTRAQLLVDLTTAVIYAEVPQAIADPSLVAKAVALEVAARAYRNSDGFSSESVDDYTYRRDSATRAAGVYVTGEERVMLQRLQTPRTRVRSLKFRSWNQEWLQ
jgi:hypothetical protein